MKYLLLAVFLLLFFSCSKNCDNELISFLTFGELISYEGTRLEMIADDSRNIVFNLATGLSDVRIGRRVFVSGGIKTESKTKREAELYRIDYVGIRTLVKKEDAENPDLSDDRISLGDFTHSGNYLNLVITTDNHLITLVENEVKVDGGKLIVKLRLYNNANDLSKDETVLSFDISDYLSYFTVDIELKYKDPYGLIKEKNLVISR